MSDTNPTQIHATGEATGFIPAPGDKGKPITVIGTNSIRAGFDATCLQQPPGYDRDMFERVFTGSGFAPETQNNRIFRHPLSEEKP